MKTFPSVLIIAVLFSCHSLFSQSSISGKVLDQSGQAIAYANALLLNAADSSLVKGNITDEEGTYTLENIDAGNYLLTISMLGYADYFSEELSLSGKGSQRLMEAITLSENAAQLDEIQVVEKRPLFEQKIDRMVVNVSNSITSAGSNAIEVLKRSPGIMVNPQSNTISMSGKEGVVIMINGKVSQMPVSGIVQLLAGMSADNIEKIELIHTPPSNFDAEGNAGFINIVLKKNLNNGLNGNFGLNFGYGKKEKAGANINFNLRKDKLNLFGDYSLDYNNNPQQFNNLRSFVKDGITFETSSKSKRDPTITRIQNARLGVDYKLSEKSVIGALAGWTDRYWDMDAFNTVVNKENNEVTGIIEVPNDELNHWQNVFGNLNFQHQFTADEKFNIDLDYVYYYFNSPSNYVNRFLAPSGELLSESGLRVAKTTPMRIAVGKSDYSKSFGEKISWETGIKGTITRFDNDVLVEERTNGTWERLPDFSSEFSMKEDIAAAYTALNIKLSAKTDLKAGLRYEYTSALLGTVEEPDIVDRNYGNFFPSLFVSNKINDNNTLQFSYSRRINRPNFNQLAPWFIFYDPTTIETGNPALQPSITDAVRLSYIWKTVQLSAEYSYEDEAIGMFQPDVDTETNTQINGAKNFDNIHMTSATLSFPVKLTDWWEIRSNLTAAWQQINDIDEGKRLVFEQASWFYNGASSWDLPDKWSIELSGYYFSPSQFGSVL